MLPGLITIAGILAALTGGRAPRDHIRGGDRDREGERYTRARHQHPAARQAPETIDGMLYVGLRPATRDAA